MPTNKNSLVFTGADWKIFLAAPGVPAFPLETVESISLDISVEQEDIHAVGDEDPIANKQNNRKYAGKISLQAGEIMSITSILGLPDATRMTNLTIALAAVRGGIQRTLRFVNINTERTDVSRKAKETLVSCDMSALTNI